MLCLCLSGCLSHTVIVSKRLHESSWLPSTYHVLYFKKIKTSRRVLPRELCPSGLRKFGHSTYTVAECDKQATVVGLLLTSFGNGGRGQMLLTADRRPSPVEHTQRSALYTARRWATGREASRCAGPSALADTCTSINSRTSERNMLAANVWMPHKITTRSIVDIRV